MGHNFAKMVCLDWRQHLYLGGDKCISNPRMNEGYAAARQMYAVCIGQMECAATFFGCTSQAAQLTNETIENSKHWLTGSVSRPVHMNFKF